MSDKRNKSAEEEDEEKEEYTLWDVDKNLARFGLDPALYEVHAQKKEKGKQTEK